MAALVPTASLVALALWTSRHWDRLPSRIPVHWGLNGADRWVLNTTVGVYGFIAVSAALSLSLMMFAWGTLHWSRRVSASSLNGSTDRRLRRLNVEVLLVISYFPAVHAWIALLRPSALGRWWGLALFGVFAIYFIRLIRAAQVSVETPIGDRTPDDCWKLGIFYFNPADPSVFVAQRFGIGYTFNLGNRWSWAVLGGLIAAIFARTLLQA
jgi:uncharacterized membrane protein